MAHSGKKIQWCALGVAVLAPSVCARLYGAFPFGGGIYLGCVASGLPVWVMLPAYLAIGIAASPTLGRIIEIAVSGLVGGLAVVPVFRKKAFLIPLYILSETGRLYEVLTGGSPWRVLPAVGLGAIALVSVLASASRPPAKAAGFFGIAAVCSVGFHAIPIAGAAVAGLLIALSVRSGKPAAIVVAYAIGGLLATRDASLPLLYVIAAGTGLVANRNRWTVGSVVLMTAAAYAVLFSPDFYACVALAGGTVVGIAIPLRRKIETAVTTTEMLPVIRKMTVAKEALKNARIVLDTAQPDEAAVCARLGVRLCDGCKDSRTCQISGAAFETATRRALDRGRAGPEILPDEIVERCPRAVQVPVILNELLSGVRQETELTQVRTAAARMAASEMRAFSALVDSWVTQAKTPVTADVEWQRETAAGLGVCGGKLISMAQSGKGLQIVAEDASEEDVLRAVNATCRTRYAVDTVTKLAGKTEYYLLPRPDLGIVYGAAQTAKQGDCGDVYFVKKINAVTVLAVLCDGMGSGSGAHELSERTVSLIEACFAAGFDTAHVLSFVNSLLGLAGERFSCVDLCLVDLERKEASFVKAGGVESYVIRGEHTVRIDGGALPLGVEGDVSPAATTVDLEPGDLIVMVSDGIMDSIDPEPARRDNPQTAADELLSLAVQADGGRPHDDMTALVLRAVS